jgi:hypothetical protein
MVTKSRAVKWDGVAKVDLMAGADVADACVGRIKLPPGHYNGETVFVPRWVWLIWGGVGRGLGARGGEGS